MTVPKYRQSKYKGCPVISKPMSTKTDPELRAKILETPCEVCDQVPGSSFNYITPSHIKPKGSGGPYTSWNVFSMCRLCHVNWEGRRFQVCHEVRTFVEFFKKKLAPLGWIWIDKKLWNEKLIIGDIEHGEEEETG